MIVKVEDAERGPGVNIQILATTKELHGAKP